MATEEAPPLYKPEMLERKKKLTLLQHCYKEPWVPIGMCAVPRAYSIYAPEVAVGEGKL